MSKTYFISDTHFGHANLVRIARTEFSDIVRHDMTIRQNWQNTVGKDDEVWMLGDFAYRCGYALEPLLRDLPGHKHLVMGNHDHTWIKQNPKALEQFESVQQMAEIDLNGLHLFLCHYPMVTWNHKPHGSIRLHGHCHAKLAEHNRLSNDLRFDVGIDGELAKRAGGFVPLELIYEAAMEKTGGVPFHQYAKQNYRSEER